MMHHDAGLDAGQKESKEPIWTNIAWLWREELPMQIGASEKK